MLAQKTNTTGLLPSQNERSNEGPAIAAAIEANARCG